MLRALRILSTLTVALAAAACGSDTGPKESDTSAPVGRTFVSTAVDGTPIPGSGPLVLEFFEPGRIAATAGCNRFSGAVDLSGGVMRSPDLASTLMACEPSREGADEWLRALFQEEPRWTLVDDEFTLTGSDITVSLLDEKILDPDRPLVGTEWVVTSLRTADAVVTSTALEEAAPTLEVAADGTLSVSTGCNEFTGRADVDAGTLRIASLPTGTAAACNPPEVADIERHMLAVLAGEVAYAVDGSSMTVTAANGVDGLEFTAS